MRPLEWFAFWVLVVDPIKKDWGYDGGESDLSEEEAKHEEGSKESVEMTRERFLCREENESEAVKQGGHHVGVDTCG